MKYIVKRRDDLKNKDDLKKKDFLKHGNDLKKTTRIEAHLLRE